MRRYTHQRGKFLSPGRLRGLTVWFQLQPTRRIRSGELGGDQRMGLSNTGRVVDDRQLVSHLYYVSPGRRKRLQVAFRASEVELQPTFGWPRSIELERWLRAKHVPEIQ